jgi:4-hydroxy-tetrahydrodipicolinate synthase
MINIQGAYTALVTPFDVNDQIDFNGLKENIEYQIQENIDGLVVLGTTGESPTISLEDQEALIRFTVQTVMKRVPVIVGTGSFSTAQAIINTQKAQKLGADGALVISPYYNKPTQEGLYRHFKAIADAVNFPIIIYNHQGRTGQNLQTATLQRLLEISSIVAVKEASGNIHQMTEVLDCIAKYRPDFKVLCGDDSLTFSLMALGGHGVISVISNLVPNLVKQLVLKAQQGDFTEARQIHFDLIPLYKGAFIETNPIAIKAAMTMCGMAAGHCRLPLCELSPANEKILKDIINHYTIKQVMQEL